MRRRAAPGAPDGRRGYRSGRDRRTADRHRPADPPAARPRPGPARRRRGRAPLRGGHRDPGDRLGGPAAVLGHRGRRRARTCARSWPATGCSSTRTTAPRSSCTAATTSCCASATCTRSRPGGSSRTRPASTCSPPATVQPLPATGSPAAGRRCPLAAVRARRTIRAGAVRRSQGTGRGRSRPGSPGTEAAAERPAPGPPAPAPPARPAGRPRALHAVRERDLVARAVPPGRRRLRIPAGEDLPVARRSTSSSAPLLRGGPRGLAPACGSSPRSHPVAQQRELGRGELERRASPGARRRRPPGGPTRRAECRRPSVPSAATSGGESQPAAHVLAAAPAR